MDCQRYTYRVLQTIQMKPTFLCVWAEQAVWGSAKTALKFKYEINCVCHSIRSMFRVLGMYNFDDYQNLRLINDQFPTTSSHLFEFHLISSKKVSFRARERCLITVIFQIRT